jgi:hypothetical protein
MGTRHDGRRPMEEKRKPGRPRIYRQAAKLQTYLDQPEYDWIRRYCEERKISLTDFVRRAVLRAMAEIAEQRRPK